MDSPRSTGSSRVLRWSHALYIYMGLLRKLKSTLGLTSHKERQETTVTVEYDPDTTPEDAVKGTDEPEATGTDAAGSTESITEEPPETPGEETASGAVDPGEAAGSTSTATDPEPTGESAGSESSDTSPEAGTESTGEDLTETATPETETDAAAGASVEEIEGIGPAYAERLREADVETVGDLRGADVTGLADETGLSEKRIDRWIERASE